MRARPERVGDRPVLSHEAPGSRPASYILARARQRDELAPPEDLAVHIRA